MNSSASLNCACGGTLIKNGITGKLGDRQRFICNLCRKTSIWKDGEQQTKRGRTMTAYQPFLIDWSLVKKCATLCSVEHTARVSTN
jgi:hypothetical protein